ncbi:hypothetical protein PV11_09882 [Exophiala sideris]|uniref:DUF7053 domain-containing protein n=1 Tax=Exophiala sideris TaxID=1016849 RepID=A0A0D1YBF8_9EURO|nr:hypothetical protein PV11_09882 [Exophiala sideris]
MPKRSLFTNITPLPPQVSREVAIAMLHNHDEMIELNPMVIEHHPIKTPRDAPADEFLDCVWQELTDKVHYLPGGMMKGKVTYRACFHDTPHGLQTHIYAPTGLDIREKWSIGGTLPGEPPEPRELGVDVPRQGLYLREDCDMRCNRMLSGFVRKNLDKAHKVLIERIMKKAERVEDFVKTSAIPMTPASPTMSFQPGSVMANSQLLQTPMTARPPMSPQMLSPQQDLGWQTLANHPAYRVDDRRMSSYGPPSYQQTTQPQRLSYYASIHQSQGPKAFRAELEGSTYHTTHLTPPTQYNSSLDNRMSMVSELSSQDATPRGSPNPQAYSDRSSMISEIPGNNRWSSQDFRAGSNQSEGSGPSDRYSMISELPSQQQRQQTARASSPPRS